MIHNRKMLKTDFIDCRKAFDTVNRDCLWYKLMKLGIHGSILRAVQSLYTDASCSVRINEYFTGFFPLKQGLKQVCEFSPPLFSIYVNDLAQEIKMLNCGIKVENIDISILVYADGYRVDVRFS